MADLPLPDPHLVAQARITQHALREFERRGLSARSVRTALEQPVEVQWVRPGHRLVAHAIETGRDGKLYLVRVFVDVDRTPFEIVTMYRTSKIEKYLRG